MKLANYFICLSIFIYCSCSNATPKEKISELACPYILPEEKDFPKSWITVGKVNSDKLQIRSIGLIDKDTSDINNRDFSEEILEDWDDFKDRSELVAEYDDYSGNMMIKCVYAKSPEESLDYNVNSVVLLIPLPPKKHLSCLLVRRNIKPEFEISCEGK